VGRCMRPRIEIDPALGSVDPSQLEALVPGLDSLGDGESATHHNQGALAVPTN
jgi:hypothetical protein